MHIKVSLPSAMAEEGGGNIKVVVRCRPLNSRGMLNGSRIIIQLMYLAV